MTMKILYEALQSTDLQEKLTGELTLHNKYIVWTYDLVKDSEENGEIDEDQKDEDDSNNVYVDIRSSEEMLTEAYDKDIELIQDYINITGDCIDRTFTDPEITKTAITFKFF